jgi:hypothetical protein
VLRKHAQLEFEKPAERPSVVSLASGRRREVQHSFCLRHTQPGTFLALDQNSIDRRSAGTVA